MLPTNNLSTAARSHDNFNQPQGYCHKQTQRKGLNHSDRHICHRSSTPAFLTMNTANDLHGAAITTNTARSSSSRQAVGNWDCLKPTTGLETCLHTRLSSLTMTTVSSCCIGNKARQRHAPSWHSSTAQMPAVHCAQRTHRLS
jgi:hypothetical protein